MEKDQKKSIFISEEETTAKVNHNIPGNDSQKLKKMLIYVLMAIACLGCLYLIFKPKSNDEVIKDAGLNNAVPQANDAALMGDKEKAYEQELLEKKEKENRNALLSLSDYLNEDSSSGTEPELKEQEDISNASLEGKKNYQDIQNTLGNFYERDYEKDALRKEIRDLKQQVNNTPSRSPITEDPIAMMEKSYQMAAKYLPQVLPQKPPADTTKPVVPKRHIEPVFASEKTIVSSLNRNQGQSDEAFIATVLNSEPSRLFSGQSTRLGSESQIAKNSIRACIQYTQTITIGSSVPIRLIEPARIAKMNIPAGTIVTATAKVQEGRLGLQITSVEFKGNIVPVDMSAYDLDGQPGLNLPFSPEVNAFKEIASGMSSSAGTNITLSSSAGQQLISDLTKGVVQGTTGYLSKRIGNVKVTVKAGHQLFLLAKKQ